jgi:predicted enzyme related to lactoylglutathione lyase
MDQTIDTWWHELNTWNALESRNFYRRTLGWSFEKVSLPDGEPYWIARKDGRTVGGLYSLTAPRFKGIPSHWMTYMKVDDIEQAEADALEGWRRSHPPHHPASRYRKDCTGKRCFRCNDRPD